MCSFFDPMVKKQLDHGGKLYHLTMLNATYSNMDMGYKWSMMEKEYLPLD
jgi:hypothetical protein